MDDLFKLEEEMEKECEKWTKNYVSPLADKTIFYQFKAGFRTGWQKCRKFYNIQ